MSKSPKSYTVLARTPEMKQRFGGKSSIQVYDEVAARDIAQAHGKKNVLVAEDDRHAWHLKHDKQTDGYKVGIHHYTFGPSAKYAEAWEAFEKRRKAKKRRGGKEYDLRETA